MWLLLLLLRLATCCWGQEAGSLLFGMSGVFSGPSASLGTNVKQGLLAAFHVLNEQGGLYGRNLTLLALDDGYERGQAYNNTLVLLASHIITAVSYVGTEPTEAALGLTVAGRVPMVAPFTGARSLRAPPNRYIVNLRGGYDEEIFAFVRMCISQGVTLFSIFYQDDAFGYAGLEALELALQNRGIAIISRGTYERNTDEVQEGLNAIRNASINPQAIVMVGTSRPLAKFVWSAKPHFPAALFYSVSFVGSEAFLDDLLAYNISAAQARDVFVTQTFPLPHPLSVLEPANISASKSLLLDFALAMNATNASLTVAGLEGYISGMFLGQMFRKMGELAASNLAFRPYLVQENVTNFKFDDDRFLAAVREYFLDVMYLQEIVNVGGLRLGPFVGNQSCVSSQLDCMQPPSGPCSQGMHNVFMSQPDLQTRAYVELYSWRTTWTDCDIHSRAVSPGTKPLIFAQTAVLSGNDGSIGVNMRAGLMAAFAEANRSPSQGVRARNLLLLSYDDFYDPKQATVNALNIIQNQSVICVVGATGTPTSVATLPLFTNASLPFIGPFTGGTPVRDSEDVVNVRAQYEDEVAAMVDYGLRQGWTRFSLFGQADAYGQAGLNSLSLVLAWHRSSMLSNASYLWGSLEVQSALNKLKLDGIPDVLILFATTDAAAAFITLAESDPKWITHQVKYFLVSFIVLEDLQQQLNISHLHSGRVFSTAVVPNYLNSSLLISRNFLSALKSYNSTMQPSFGAMEGYIAGRLTVLALERAHDFTGSSLLQEIFAPGQRTVDDLQLGPYELGKCNLGLRVVYVLRLDSTNFTELGSFRATTSNKFVNDCGALSVYSNPSCPDGYRKQDIDSSTLDSQCIQCPLETGCLLQPFKASFEFRDILLGVNIMASCLDLSFVVMVICYRKSSVIKAASPRFCLLILTGSIFGYVTVFLLYAGLKQDFISNMICSAQVFTLNTCFCFLFGSLFVKTYRVTRIFDATKLVHVNHLADRYLFLVVGSLWLVEMVYTATWQTLDPLHVQMVVTPTYSALICQSRNSSWGIVNILFNALGLVYGILLTIQARTAPLAFNESKYIATTLYHALVVGSILVVEGYASSNDEDIFFYKALGIFLICTVGMLLLFGSKACALRSELARKNEPPRTSCVSIRLGDEEHGDPQQYRTFGKSAKIQPQEKTKLFPKRRNSS